MSRMVPPVSTMTLWTPRTARPDGRPASPAGPARKKG